MLVHNYFKIKMIDYMTDEQLLEFSRINEGFKIERSKDRKITMAPTSTDTGFFNNELSIEFNIWNRKHQKGYVFDSSTGFKLPDESLKSPDLAWISKERWSQLKEEEKIGFAQIAPDFVLELKSYSDRLDELKKKMLDYIENGTLLAWLIDRTDQKVYIYRADGSISILKSFDEKISGEAILADFELDLSILNKKI